MDQRKTYEVESIEDLRQVIEELPDGVMLEVSVKRGGDQDELRDGSSQHSPCKRAFVVQ